MNNMYCWQYSHSHLREDHLESVFFLVQKVAMVMNIINKKNFFKLRHKRILPRVPFLLAHFHFGRIFKLLQDYFLHIFEISYTCRKHASTHFYI